MAGTGLGPMKKVFNNMRRPEGRIGRMTAGGMNTGGRARPTTRGLSHLRIRGDEQAGRQCGKAARHAPPEGV